METTKDTHIPHIRQRLGRWQLRTLIIFSVTWVCYLAMTLLHPNVIDIPDDAFIVGIMAMFGSGGLWVGLKLALRIVTH